jgi:glycine cleavage system H protein
MNYPENLRYTKEHEWILVEGDTATIGITAYAQSELGDIVFVDINTIGDVVQKDSVFGTVEAVKTVSDLFMPITGEVLEMNDELNNAPETVNSDPYGSGWLIKAKIQHPEEVAQLMSAADYKAMYSL